MQALFTLAWKAPSFITHSDREKGGGAFSTRTLCSLSSHATLRRGGGWEPIAGAGRVRYTVEAVAEIGLVHPGGVGGANSTLA